MGSYSVLWVELVGVLAGPAANLHTLCFGCQLGLAAASRLGLAFRTFRLRGFSILFSGSVTQACFVHSDCCGNAGLLYPTPTTRLLLWTGLLKGTLDHYSPQRLATRSAVQVTRDGAFEPLGTAGNP